MRRYAFRRIIYKSAQFSSYVSENNSVYCHQYKAFLEGLPSLTKQEQIIPWPAPTTEMSKPVGTHMMKNVVFDHLYYSSIELGVEFYSQQKHYHAFLK